MPGLKSMRMDGNEALVASLPPQMIDRPMEDLKQFLRCVFDVTFGEGWVDWG